MHMNEELPFDESTLSEDDLAVLRAFDAIESWETDLSATHTSSTQESSMSSTEEAEDMLSIFLTEVEEDISGMLQVLQQSEQVRYVQPSHFVALQRLGHKMRGTAGAVGYLKMSEVAAHVEIIAEQVVHHMLQPGVGGKAISHAITVLEFCMYRLVQDGQEPADAAMLIANLQFFYTNLSIDLEQPIREDLPPLPPPAQSKEERPVFVPSVTSASFQLSAEAPAAYTSSQALQESSSQAASSYVGLRPFDTLIHHSERLLAQHASMNHAYKQVETAFQNLQAAQARFQHLETLFSISLAQERLSEPVEDLSSSSLITRIFNNATSRDGFRSRRSKASKARSRSTSQQTSYQQASAWDELDIEHYSEKDMLLRSLREAMTDIDTCSMRLRAAYQSMHKFQQEYMSHVIFIRNDAMSMRMTPFSTITPSLRDVVMTSMLAKERQVDFEVTGDGVEVDQEILSSLSPLLIHLLQTSIDNVTDPQSLSPGRAWLHAHVIGSEVCLEIGFSMPVRGGALQMLREQLHLFNGSISLDRNTGGGISFYLRFPRIRGLLQCLLVRVADQRLLIPLSHVEHVGYTTQATTDSFYHLGSLLDMAVAPGVSTPSASTIQQVVFMQLPTAYTQREPLKILVDEVVDEIELMVRPLAPHLRRPGIMSSTIDGEGNVLLLLNIAELVSNYAKKTARMTSARPLKILVADDSASFRGSILQTLRRTNYQIKEARDGLEALELLKLDTPDVILLDIEMPYLNGYDLLDILHHNSQFSTIKIIMLTSRTSEKHLQHALDLGAHAYLTKPSPPEELLTTIQQFRPPTKSPAD